MDVHPAWDEAAASVQSDVDADLRAEAYDLFRAETGRTRLEDRLPRPGSRLRVVVRSGTVISGLAAPDDDQVGGMLVVVDDAARIVLVPRYAIVTASGLSAALRVEEAAQAGACAGWTISARLRESAQMGDVVAAVLVTGLRVAGEVDRVGADHIDFDRGSAGLLTVPFAAVDAWYLAP